MFLLHTFAFSHSLTLSPSHPLTLSSSHPLTLSPSHPLTLSPSHPLTLSPSHPLTLSPSHPLTSSHPLTPFSHPLSLSPQNQNKTLIPNFLSIIFFFIKKKHKISRITFSNLLEPSYTYNYILYSLRRIKSIQFNSFNNNFKLTIPIFVVVVKTSDKRNLLYSTLK
jgi:hypothetical protein